MDTNRILAELRTERDRLNQAIAALESLDSSGSTAARRGLLPATAAQAAPKPARGGRRRISAAGRRRIAEAARAMWARRKKAASDNKTTFRRNATPARHMSAATRKRLSELAKQRWALRKQAQRA